jgi:hypothetical protein
MNIRATGLPPDLDGADPSPIFDDRRKFPFPYAWTLPGFPGTVQTKLVREGRISGLCFIVAIGGGLQLVRIGNRTSFGWYAGGGSIPSLKQRVQGIS